MAKKISFDFDDTLSLPEMQNFANHLEKKYNVEIWVVTARSPDDITVQYGTDWNSDLWEVCKRLKIPKERVIFRSFLPKYKYFEKNTDFIAHIDDYEDENIEIRNNTNIPAINHNKSANWAELILNLLINYDKQHNNV